ncbi:MAG: response regulator, partial [Bryobacteraceae bacterium]
SGVSGESDHLSAALSGHRESLAALANVGNSERRVLIAEDNPANRMVARLTLEKFGFQVHEAADGTEALEAAQKVRFDVILMDCRMPGMDGYEATRQIRQLGGASGKAPVIALTASAFKEDRIRAEQAGMNDFIAKPFQDEELVRKCLSWISSPGKVFTPDNTNQAPTIAPPLLLKPLEKYPPEFLRSLLEIFIETAPPVFQRLVSSIENRDWEGAKTSAHWLRGGASRVIAPELQDQLTTVENACGADSPDVSPPEVQSLTNEFHNACQIAENWLAEHRAYSTKS